MSSLTPRQERLLREALKRRSKETKTQVVLQNLRASLFRQQRNLFDDPAKMRAVHSGRRAGKTHAARAIVLRTLLEIPGCFVPILELTRTCAAARVFWKGMCKLLDEHGVGYQSNKLEMTIRLENGSEVAIFGANQSDLAERFRGDAYPLVVFDEVGSFRPSILEYLIKESVGPAMLDYDGSILVIGTPGAPFGPYYDICHSDLWSVHHWTCLNNTGLKVDVRKWLASYRKDQGWAEDHPIYMREWLGKWVVNTDNLVYEFETNRNTCKRIDADVSKLRYVLGIDLGYNDSTAFSVLAYHPKTTNVWCVEVFKRTELIPSAVAAEVEKLQQRYQFNAIVADSGGMGKGYVEEMKQSFGLPILNAEKTQKFSQIEFFNGSLRTGRLKFVRPEADDAIEEMSLLQWSNKNLRKIDDKYEDHAMDATLYAHRHVHSHLLRNEEVVPKRGEPGYSKYMDDKIMQAEIDALTHDGEPDWKMM